MPMLEPPANFLLSFEGELLYDKTTGQTLYDESNPPTEPDVPEVTAILLMDANTGELLYDLHTGETLYDLNDFVYPVIPGEIDPTGSPIGGPVSDRVFLVETPALNITTPEGLTMWLSIAANPTASMMMEPVEISGPEGLPPVQFRLASADFVSRHDDPDQPSQWWDGRVLDPGSIDISMPLVPVDRASIEATYGQIIAANTDAVFDTILDTNLAISQQIVIKAGRKGLFVGEFLTVCTARITAVGMTEEQLTLEIKDPAAFAGTLFPTSTYGGSGGMEGTEELKGTVKPVVMGRVWNMAPTLIDPVQLIYQAHDGGIVAVSGVFDGGVPLDATGDYATYSALVAADVDPGDYATCLNEGMIKIGGSPVFAVTAHVDGLAAAGTTIRSIATWLVGQLDEALDIEVDLDTFQSLPEHVAGWIWQEPFPYAKALDRFVGDAGFCWMASPAGPIVALRLDLPGSPVALGYGTDDIVSIERAQPPDGYGSMHHRRIVRFGKNWTVQQGQLAATAESSGFRQKEWRIAQESRTVLQRNAIDPPVLDTSLATLSDAALLADRLLDLHGEPRRFFSVEIKISGVLPQLGTTVQIVHPRFALSGGALFRIIGIRHELAESTTQLLLWG